MNEPLRPVRALTSDIHRRCAIMVKCLSAILILLPALAAMGADTPPAAPCSAAEYRQFDFWLGQWTSSSAEGKTQGTNRIEKIMGGCVIQENWASGKFQGTSFNFYDAADKHWHQTWVDNGGGSLRLTGGLIDGTMKLSQQQDNGDGGTVIQRITWTPQSNGKVHQHWQSSADNGQTWQDVFNGFYEKQATTEIDH